MLENTFYLYCRFKGLTNKNYTSNKNYLLKVRVGKFNGVVRIMAFIHDEWLESTDVRYDNKQLFEKSWKVIEDKTSQM